MTIKVDKKVWPMVNRLISRDFQNANLKMERTKSKDWTCTIFFCFLWTNIFPDSALILIYIELEYIRHVWRSISNYSSLLSLLLSLSIFLSLSPSLSIFLSLSIYLYLSLSLSLSFSLPLSLSFSFSLSLSLSISISLSLYLSLGGGKYFRLMRWVLSRKVLLNIAYKIFMNKDYIKLYQSL